MLFVAEEVIVSKLVKKIIYIIMLLFTVFVAINLIFIQKIYTWNSVSFAIGSLLVVASSIYYFLELFKRPNSVNLVKEPAFWICSGLLFFYCCSFPLLGLNNFFINAPIIVRQNIGVILMLLNVMYYILFTIAFLCRINFRKLFSMH
jgi:hypothetical protein